MSESGTMTAQQLVSAIIGLGFLTVGLIICITLTCKYRVHHRFYKKEHNFHAEEHLEQSYFKRQSQIEHPELFEEKRSKESTPRAEPSHTLQDAKNEIVVTTDVNTDVTPRAVPSHTLGNNDIAKVDEVIIGKASKDSKISSEDVEQLDDPEGEKMPPRKTPQTPPSRAAPHQQDGTDFSSAMIAQYLMHALLAYFILEKIFGREFINFKRVFDRIRYKLGIWHPKPSNLYWTNQEKAYAKYDECYFNGRRLILTEDEMRMHLHSNNRNLITSTSNLSEIQNAELATSDTLNSISSEENNGDENHAGQISAINARELTGSANSELAFLLYTLYGVDTYPGYLTARFSMERNHGEKLVLLANMFKEKMLQAEVLSKEAKQRSQLLKQYRKGTEIEKKFLNYKVEDIIDPQLGESLGYLILSDSKKNKRKKSGNTNTPTNSNPLSSSWPQHYQSSSFTYILCHASTLDKNNPPPYLQKLADNEELFDEVCPDTYKFKMLSEKFCKELIDEIEHFLNWLRDNIDSRADGTAFLNTRLCVLDHMGRIGPHILDLVKQISDKLTPWLFADVCQDNINKGGLDYRFGYTIGYCSKEDLLEKEDQELKAARNSGKSEEEANLLPKNVTRSALDWHTDDSEVTLTIRLGKDFSGGNVVLRHQNDDTRRGDFQTRIVQKTGEATLFYGQQNHEVEPVLSGERQMLVVWFRSTSFRSRVCPCCRMWRRFGQLRDFKSNFVGGKNCCYDQCVLADGNQ